MCWWKISPPFFFCLSCKGTVTGLGKIFVHQEGSVIEYYVTLCVSTTVDTCTWGGMHARCCILYLDHPGCRHLEYIQRGSDWFVEGSHWCSDKDAPRSHHCWCAYSVLPSDAPSHRPHCRARLFIVRHPPRPVCLDWPAHCHLSFLCFEAWARTGSSMCPAPWRGVACCLRSLLQVQGGPTHHWTDMQVITELWKICGKGHMV